MQRLPCGCSNQSDVWGLNQKHSCLVLFAVCFGIRTLERSIDCLLKGLPFSHSGGTCLHVPQHVMWHAKEDWCHQSANQNTWCQKSSTILLLHNCGVGMNFHSKTHVHTSIQNNTHQPWQNSVDIACGKKQGNAAKKNGQEANKNARQSPAFVSPANMATLTVSNFVAQNHNSASFTQDSSDKKLKSWLGHSTPLEQQCKEGIVGNLGDLPVYAPLHNPSLSLAPAHGSVPLLLQRTLSSVCPTHHCLGWL